MLCPSNKIYKEILQRGVCCYQGGCLICPAVHIYLRPRQNIFFLLVQSLQCHLTNEVLATSLVTSSLVLERWRNLGLGITLPFGFTCISLKVPSYNSNEYSINTCVFMCLRERERTAVIWISCGGSPIVSFHCSSSFVHFSNHVKNFPVVYECSSHRELLPHRKMSCLKYFTLTHWSSAAQVHDVGLQPGFSEIPKWCAGSVLPRLSAATLHGF